MPVFYASPTGTGDGLTPGTAGSLETVQMLARGATGDVEIVLRGGEYQLTSPISLTTIDSGKGGRVRWRASPGELPTLSGAVPVSGWALLDSGMNLWRAPVSPGVLSRQLYVNGVRATRARRTVGMSALSTPDGGASYVSTDASIPALSRPNDIEFVFTGMAADAWRWMQSRLSVASAALVGSTTTFTMNAAYAAWNNSKAAAPWPQHPSWIENALEFLDATTVGCWYLDSAAGYVYYVPRAGEDMGTANVRMPVIGALVQGSAGSPVSDVDFDGIAFEHTTWTRPSVQGSFITVQANQYLDRDDPRGAYYWGLSGGLAPAAAVSLPGAEAINFLGCVFRHLGGVGLELTNGAKRSSVVGCEFFDISSNAVRLGDLEDPAPDPSALTSYVDISACLIRDVGIEFWGGCGVFAGKVDHVRILDNEIRDVPYTGISIGWWDASAWYTGFIRNNEIGRNHVHGIMATGLHDGAGIYVLGVQGDASNPTSIHHNYVHDVGSAPVFGSDSCFYLDTGEWVALSDNVAVQSAYGTPALWYFSNSHNNTATRTYASGALTASGSLEDGLVGVQARIAITGTDPAAWPAAARAIAAEAGPVTQAYGDAGGLAATTATLTQARPLSGSAGGKAATSGSDPASLRATASSGGQAGASATLTSQPPVGGTAGGSGGAVATLRAIAPVPYAVLTATSDDGEEVAFGVRGWTLDAEDGTSIGVGIAPTGYFGPGVELSGAAAGHAGATAAPGVLQQLAGAAAGHADGRASTGDVSGVAGGHADGSGTLRQARPLSGAADGHAGASATGLQLPTPLAGTAGGHGDATGDVRRVPLGGTADGHAGAAATLRQAQRLAGVAAGHAAAQASPVLPVAEHSILGAKPIRFGLLARAVPHGHRPRSIHLGLAARRGMR